MNNLSERYNRVYGGDIKNSPVSIGIVKRNDISTISKKGKRGNKVKGKSINEALGKVSVLLAIGVVLFFSVGVIGELEDSGSLPVYESNNEELGDVIMGTITEQVGKVSGKMEEVWQEGMTY